MNMVTVVISVEDILLQIAAQGFAFSTFDTVG